VWFRARNKLPYTSQQAAGNIAVWAPADRGSFIQARELGHHQTIPVQLAFSHPSPSHSQYVDRNLPVMALLKAFYSSTMAFTVRTTSMNLRVSINRKIWSIDQYSDLLILAVTNYTVIVASSTVRWKDCPIGSMESTWTSCKCR
jgi:hypothetical protein